MFADPERYRAYADRVQTKLTRVVVGTIGTTTGIGANAGRVAIRMSISGMTDPTAPSFASIGYIQGGVWVALGTVSRESPVCDFDVSRVGPDMLGALNFQAAGTTITVTVCETILIR